MWVVGVIVRLEGVFRMLVRVASFLGAMLVRMCVLMSVRMSMPMHMLMCVNDHAMAMLMAMAV
jgi:hypothetical protein